MDLTDSETSKDPIPDTSVKSDTSPTSAHTSGYVAIRENPHDSIVCETETNVTPPTQSSLEQLSCEVLKIVTALHLLKMPPNGDRVLSPELLSTLSQKKEAPDAASLLTNAAPTTPPQIASAKTPPRFPISVPLPPHCSRGPFVRLVTQGRATLVHLGQLVGILDDRSGFLLQRVVSFDPRRVELKILSRMGPLDILALTEGKREQKRQEEKRARSVNLLQQVITTNSALESEKCAYEEPRDVGFHSLTTAHGPVLTTPGLVLIRADQVRQLGLIAENDPTENILESWGYLGKCHHKFHNTPEQQQQAPNQEEQSSLENLNTPETTENGATENARQMPAQDAAPLTPISRPKAGNTEQEKIAFDPSTGQATSSTVKKERQAAATQGRNDGTTKTDSGEVRSKSYERRSTRRANRPNGPSRRRRPFRRRAGTKQSGAVNRQSNRDKFPEKHLSDVATQMEYEVAAKPVVRLLTNDQAVISVKSCSCCCHEGRVDEGNGQTRTNYYEASSYRCHGPKGPTCHFPY